MPAGCVVHVAPSNVFTVAAMGMVEGLLAGNLNVVKASARDGDFAPLFAQALAAHDPVRGAGAVARWGGEVGQHPAVRLRKHRHLGRWRANDDDEYDSTERQVRRRAGER